MFSGVPKQGDKIRSGYLTRAVSTAQKRAKERRDPWVLIGPQRSEQTQKWLPHPYRAQKRAEMLPTPAFSAIPKQGDTIRRGCLTLAFSRAPKRVKLLGNPCVVGDSQIRGEKQVAASSLPSKWTQKRAEVLNNPSFSGVPKQGD